MRADRPPWICRTFGHVNGWTRVGDVDVGQCKRRRCRLVLSTLVPPTPLRGIDALQATDGRPAPDWPGCRD